MHAGRAVDRRRPGRRRTRPYRRRPWVPGVPTDGNGPEFVSHAFADWCRFNNAQTVFIQPGSRWQNAWIESFIGRVRDELLNGELFGSLLEAQVIVEDWRSDYNTNRPHSTLRMLTPAAYAHTQAAQWAAAEQTPAPADRPLLST